MPADMTEPVPDKPAAKHPGRASLCIDVFTAAEAADEVDLDGARAAQQHIWRWLDQRPGKDPAKLAAARAEFGDDAVFAFLFMDCLEHAAFDTWAKYRDHLENLRHRLDMLVVSFRRFGFDRLSGGADCLATLQALRRDRGEIDWVARTEIPESLCGDFERWVRGRFLAAGNRASARRTKLPARDGLSLLLLAASMRSALGRDPTVAEFAAELRTEPDARLARILADISAGTFDLADGKAKTRPRRPQR